MGRRFPYRKMLKRLDYRANRRPGQSWSGKGRQLQREYFILKPKEVPVKSGLGQILPGPRPGGPLETLGCAWERTWEQGRMNALLSFISMS